MLSEPSHATNAIVHVRRRRVTTTLTITRDRLTRVVAVVLGRSKSPRQSLQINKKVCMSEAISFSDDTSYSPESFHSHVVSREKDVITTQFCAPQPQTF
jgi:hypothetical protein